MKRRLTITNLFVLWLAQVAYAADRPNIIVIFTDDHGYADLGCQGVLDDVRTPHIDRLAAEGVRMTSGYVTAPQCVPSRAGLLTGRYQNRFGVERNGVPLAGFNAQQTIAERLKEAGYATGMTGKWHLGAPPAIVRHGFDDVYYKNANRPGWANFDLEGNDRPPGAEDSGLYHIDANSAAACAFIERHHEEPFFFYCAYRAPHVPLDAPPKYLERFPGQMPERRRKALAMISAIDDGVGRIMSTLREQGLEEKTLIFLIGDNGAPLKIHKVDAPGGGPGWDGSLNDPLNGEKGMLTEGGIRVPFVVSWKGTIPGGQSYHHPVISLDVAATALAIAGLPEDPEVDGVNLLPYLRSEKEGAPHEALYWRWVAQSAVREGNWKYLRGGEREYLFDLDADREEKRCVLAEHPEVAKRLRSRLEKWSSKLAPPGLATRDMAPVWQRYFDHYLEAATEPKPEPQPSPDPPSSAEKPNLLFILADDLGWADTTLYGHTTFYRTPNVERLARRGMTFPRAYSASPLCSPTRASILTGLSPARTGITSPACHLQRVVLEATPAESAPPGVKATTPGTVTRLKTEYYTLAEALRDAGYATGHFGKWHLGHPPYSPLEHGFDVDVPHWPGPGPAGSYVAPWRFPDFDPDTPDEHIEDRMAREAVAFLEKHRDQPFFLNYWMFSVHAPFDAKKQLIEKHRRRVDPSDEQRSPTYAAMIESMDDAVGTLLDTLERLKIADRTIVIFFSDNGGNMYDEVDGTTPTSNRPLRGGKATMFEGGVRVPCSVIWPGVVRPNTRSDTVIQSSDFYPTILEMLDLEPREGQRFDGVSIVPALREQPLVRGPIFTYFPHAPRVPDWLPPSVSVHQNDWKLIRIFHGGEGGAHRWKLFHLREDIGERRDLAASQPERVKELDSLIEGFLQQTKAVVPLPNPDFDPAQYHPENEGKPALRKNASTRDRRPARSPSPR